MRILTLNFLTCAVQTCKTSAASYPLHPREAELATDEMEYNPQALLNLLPRLDWTALKTTATELGFKNLQEEIPTADELSEDESKMRQLHELLLETHIISGSLICGNCGHEYGIKEGIANFLLPSHLV